MRKCWSFAETRNDASQIDLLEGKSLLLVDNKDQVEKPQDKKVEPAIPDEKEVVEVDKQEKKNERLPEKVNPGLCSAPFSL